MVIPLLNAVEVLDNRIQDMAEEIAQTATVTGPVSGSVCDTNTGKAEIRRARICGMPGCQKDIASVQKAVSMSPVSRAHPEGLIELGLCRDHRKCQGLHNIPKTASEPQKACDRLACKYVSGVCYCSGCYIQIADAILMKALHAIPKHIILESVGMRVGGSGAVPAPATVSLEAPAAQAAPPPEVPPAKVGPAQAEPHPGPAAEPPHDKEHVKVAPAHPLKIATKAVVEPEPEAQVDQPKAEPKPSAPAPKPARKNAKRAAAAAAPAAAAPAAAAAPVAATADQEVAPEAGPAPPAPRKVVGRRKKAE